MIWNLFRRTPTPEEPRRISTKLSKTYSDRRARECREARLRFEGKGA